MATFRTFEHEGNWYGVNTEPDENGEVEAFLLEAPAAWNITTDSPPFVGAFPMVKLESRPSNKSPVGFVFGPVYKRFKLGERQERKVAS